MRYHSPSDSPFAKDAKSMVMRYFVEEERGQRALLPQIIRSRCMRDAGRKTPEKARSAGLQKGSEAKPLVNTLFMMFNSRYRGTTVDRIIAPILSSEGLVECTIF